MENGINTPNEGNLRDSFDRNNFSDTEIAIIRMICEEKTTEDIAKELNLSKRKIVSHRQRLLAKTGSRGGIGILTYAIKHGIFKND